MVDEILVCVECRETFFFSEFRENGVIVSGCCFLRQLCIGCGWRILQLRR